MKWTKTRTALATGTGALLLVAVTTQAIGLRRHAPDAAVSNLTTRSDESFAAAGRAAVVAAPMATTAAMSAPPGGLGVRDAKKSSEETPKRKPLLEVHAQFQIRVDSAARVRELAAFLETFADKRDGHVSQSAIPSDGAATISIRIPATEIPALRAALGNAGELLGESTTTTDVTDKIVDLDARLKNSRIQEARVQQIIAKNTGSIADVLEADRELAAIRGEIERLDATRRAAQGRVDLATVDVTVTTIPIVVPPPKIVMPTEPSAASRLALAATRGVRAAGATLLHLGIFALEAGPVMILFAAPLVGIFLVVRRRVRKTRNAEIALAAAT